MRIVIVLTGLAVAAGVSSAQIANFQLQGVTATQAVVSYTSPDSRACRIELSESPRYLPVVPDVDPRIFPLSNMDLERNSTVSGGRNARVVVLGRRAAESGSNGRRYSRALQAYTKHYLRITCGTAIREAVFDTTNIAIGQTYNDPLPGDPDKPGEYGWPTLDWSDRFQRVVDPKTGLLIQRVTMTEDMIEAGGPRQFVGARNPSAAWTNPGAALVNDTQAAIASQSGWLFLEGGWTLFAGGTREYNADTIRQLSVTLNAWCEDCGVNSTPDRTIEACISLDGVTCGGKPLEAILENCSADCTSSRYRFTLGANGPPVTTAWDLDKWDQTHFHRRTGQVTRRGNQVRWTGGQNVFNVAWARGAQIEINNRSYSIRRVNHEKLITLEGDFEENEQESGSYVGSNFGLMIRRKVAGAGRVMVQHAQFSWQYAFAVRWDSGGDIEEFNTCAPGMSKGPGGEMGWHCMVGATIFWIGGDTGTVNRLGQSAFPDRAGPDGWGGHGLCDAVSGGGPQWDPEDPDSFYCGQPSNTPGAGTVLVRARYIGENADVGPFPTFWVNLTECNPARTNAPCFELTNVTPPSKGLGLNNQLARMHPAEWNLLRNSRIVITSLRGKYIQFIARFQNDSLAISGLIEPRAGQIAAAVPSWRYWPLRWSGYHGGELLMGNEWLPLTPTFFRGSPERDFGPGVGPYVSRITSGPLPNTGSTCPPRPANSLIPPHEWPEGERCVEITIDGEPGDPSPYNFSTGTINSNGAVVTGTGVEWEPRFDGGQMLVNGQWYRFERLSNTSGRLTPEPTTPLRAALYQLFGEPVNNPKTANPLHAYLQDIEPRDILVITPRLGFNIDPDVNEFLRVIVKDGKRLVLERGLAGWNGKPNRMHAVPANSYAFMVASGCRFLVDGYCLAASVMWNIADDPTGKNSAGNTVVLDDTGQGSGHGTSAATASINAVASTCPRIDGLQYGCYNVRPGRSFPDRYGAENFVIANNPAFQGRVGIGEPNAVDSHPSSKQRIGVASDADLGWFLDARPFFGISNSSPGVEVEEGLWKFRAGQIQRFRPRHMPVIAYCAGSPLRDLSGPGSRIVGTSEEVRTNAYSYCVAGKEGECREDSQSGEVFVSCPQISAPYCVYPGIAVNGGDTRDICIGDNGAYSQGITQIRHTEPDGLTGRGGRILTYGLSQWRFNDPFWNARSTPDGKWLIFRPMWANNKRPDAFLAKIPPFEPIDDQARNGYLTLDLQVRQADAPELATAVVEFGYNPSMHCTSRQESCMAVGSAGEMDMSDPFRYSQTEDWSPVACKEGCTLRIPVIPQRVVYYRIHYFNEAGVETAQSTVNAWAVP